jgi:HlyD family secretion protein
VIEELPNSLLLPETAIIYDDKRNAFVNIVDAGQRSGFRRVPVKVGAGNGTRMQILSGVNAGDRVVIPS